MHLIAALFAFSLPVDEVALWADYLDRCDAAILEQADYVVERLDEKHGNPYYRFEIHSRGGEHVLSQSALSPDGARLERFQGVNIRKDRVEIIDFPDHGSIDIVANDGELPMGRVAVPHPDWLGVQLGYHPCRAWAKGDIVRSYDPETLVLVHGPKNAPDMEYRVHFRRTDDGKLERLKEEKYAFGHKQMSWDYEVSDDGESKTYEVTFCLYGKDEIDGSEPVTTKHYRVHPPAHRASDELSFHEFPPDRTVTDFRSDPPLTYGSTGQRSIELPPGEADSCFVGGEDGAQLPQPETGLDPTPVNGIDNPTSSQGIETPPSAANRRPWRGLGLLAFATAGGVVFVLGKRRMGPH